LQDIPIPGGVDTIGVMLAGLAAAHYPRDPATDALARYLERRQAADGGWRVAADRPPIESSSMAITAWAIRGLRAYAPIPQKDSYQRSIARGVEWLRRQQPTTTEDHVFQLLGSVWAGESASPRRDAAGRLLALQRADGGWGQIPTLPSDAYATGQALTALAQSGAVSPATAAYQRGVRFLLTTQMRDGSWHVRTRAIPVQPYFESGFPHERDQFISAAATNWAVMALAPAVR
jgi:N-acyl-D-amino-acid deacylase